MTITSLKVTDSFSFLSISILTGVYNLQIMLIHCIYIWLNGLIFTHKQNVHKIIEIGHIPYTIKL